MDQTQPTVPDSESLESTTESGSEQNTASAAPTPPPKKGLVNKLRSILGHLNIYLLIFILLVVIALIVVYVSIQASKKEEAKTNTTTQSLSEEALKNLQGSDAKVGDAKQTLSVESNAIFAGKVLIRDGLEVAGAIKVGSSLSLPGLTVSGTSSFDQIQSNNLAVSGNATVSGLLSVQKGLTVSGPTTFSAPISAPSITIERLQINQDINFSRHIDAGGPTPSWTTGSAVGSGGTVSVSGTDTAGTITVNIGSGAPCGVFAAVSFATKYNGIPHVVVSPIGSGAAELNWYIANRSTSGFSVACTGSPTPSPGSFSFDYIAID